ncbi:MAG: ribonuclease HI [Gemmatimonadota bacterium]|nr:MAG: ribonuclease HI [Gemmatimonadota bacterium]
MRYEASQGIVYLHADESCLGNQFSDRATPGGAAGLIELFDRRSGWHRRDYYVSERDTTNNRMALRSATVGLDALTKPCRVAFYSDSNYLIRGAKDWIHNWAKRGWTRKSGSIENLELWIDLVRAWKRHVVEWRWVRGHAGDPKNEYVNHLAVEAARQQKHSRGLVESGFEGWLEEQRERGRYLEFIDLPPESEFRPDPAPPTPPR